MAVVINGTTGVTTPTESVATTIGVGGATPSASGAGITFPATQSASTDANTLDDYEEGTWTPTFSSPVNLTGTPSTSGATYTKVGRLVYLTSRITGYSVTSSNTATYPVVNVPFPMISNTSPVTGSVFAVVGGVFVSGALCDNSSGNTSEIALVMPAVSITTSGSITIDFSIVYQTT